MTAQRFTRAFTWFSYAGRVDGRVERFLALWLAVMLVTLYRKRGKPCSLIETYVDAMGVPDRCELVDRLRSAYNVRNVLMHTGVDLTTQELVDALQADAERLIPHAFGMLTA